MPPRPCQTSFPPGHPIPFCESSLPLLCILLPSKRGPRSQDGMVAAVEYWERGQGGGPLWFAGPPSWRYPVLHAIIHGRGGGSMALFNPPLYKPGNKKCPNCGRGQWFQLNPLMLSSWSWECRQCKAILEDDAGRSTLSWLFRTAFVVLGILGLRPWDISGWFYVAMVVGGLVVVTWWFDTVRLKETRKH